MSFDVCVVGGVYSERCILPPFERNVGSGGRGAGYLAEAGYDVQLHYPTNDVSRRIDSIGARVSTEPYHDDHHYDFQYLHPLSIPILTKMFPDKRQVISVDADVCLAFGMMEAKFDVSANKAVFDLQAGQFLQSKDFSGTWNCDEFALVLNQTEAEALLGRSGSLEDLASSLKVMTEADVVIIKAGLSGAYYTCNEGCGLVPPYQAWKHNKIGSGDVYSASFCRFWALENLPVKAAAEKASATVALFLEYDRYITNEASVSSKLNSDASFSPKSVYLAGSFFDIGGRWRIEESNRILTSWGHNVLSPVHDIGVVNGRKKNEIAEADLDLLRDADVVFAIVSDFDAGTLIEIGWALANEKKVIAYTGEIISSDLSDERYTMLNAEGVMLMPGFADAIAQIGWSS